MSESRWNRPPVVILTALELEFEAVRDRLAGPWESQTVAGTRFEVGSLGNRSGKVVLGVTGQGTHGSAVIAERSIRAFSPRAVLFVGVAGALRSHLRLGDVVVATHVYAYQGAAARTGGLRSRPRVWEVDHTVEQAAREVARRRARAGNVGPGAGRLTVHFGPVASGEILHDSSVSAPLRWIQEHYDDALAIEMEAAGVAKAGHLSAAPVAVVRAISDRADGTKARTDGADWQRLAARNAAAVAVGLAAELLDQHSESGEAVKPASGITVNTHGGRHGAVAGVIDGGVHNNARPGRRTGPVEEDRGGS